MIFRTMRTLIIQTSFLGDAVLTTPLIERAAQSGELDVLCIPASAPLLANNPAIREVIIYDKRGRDRGLAGFWRLAAQLRRKGYDRTLLAQGSMRSSSLAMIAGIPVRVGFDTSAGRALYTDRVPYIENEHHAVRLLRLDRGAEAAQRTRPSLYPTEVERRAVDELLAGATGPFIGVAPGSVWATKRWPGYAALAAAITEGTIVIIGSAADREPAAAIQAAAPNAIDATGKLSLLASAELIRRCAVLVTNDSAPQHLASAMNTPTVTIFGPTVPQFGFGPLAERATTVGMDSLACRPCDRHGPVACPLGHWKCMREVTAAEVATAVARLSSRV